jgi:predicted transposase YdaD
MGKNKPICYNRAMKRDKKIHQPHDKGYKYVLKSKKEFLELLKGFIKEQWVETIREDQIVRIDKTFIDTHFQTKEADIVYKYTNANTDTIFYILLEHQSTVDKKMMFRLLTYMVEIWRDYLNEKKFSIALAKDDVQGDNEFSIPAIIPIVLYTGSTKWTAATQFKEIIKEADKYREHILNFKSLMIDTGNIADEEFLKQESVIAFVLYLDKVNTLGEFFEKYRKVRMSYAKLTEEEKRMLNKWTKDILLERFDKKTKKVIEEILDEKDPSEVMKMMTNLERVIEKEFEQRYVDGMEYGEKKGIEKGIKLEKEKTLLEKEKSLLEKEKALFNLYSKGFPLEQIAESFELSKERALKMIASAKKKLKN